ncbi:MAG: hypothetical protein KAW51_06690 [Candidatus Lokiarchaeota archaeon]|nr:hypothetical protein [Candidatus Lokiarchaeota archaeon]
MNDIENDKIEKSEIPYKPEEEKKKPEKRVKKTQGQMIQEALGLGPTDIQDVEKKLFIVRFLDYFSEETLDFIFKDSTLNQYNKQITSHIEELSTKGEEDRLLKQSFESKKIFDTVFRLKGKAEEIATSKGVKGSMDKRLRRLTLYLTAPMFALIIVSFIWTEITMVLLPVLCVFCMAPQLIKGRVVKKWFAFKEQNKNQIYTENKADIMVLKNFTGETLDNVRARLLELKVPLQLIKFTLNSRDYENVTLLNQKNIRGTMQYFYTFEYPQGVEPFQIPQQLMQYQQPIIPEKRKPEKLEKNFVVLTEMKGKDGIVNDFVPTLKDNLAEKINDMLNNSEFSKSPSDFTAIIPNYSEKMAIFCICGEVVEINVVQICHWKNQLKFYLFEGEPCNCGETVYALSLMDESAELPEELKDIFLS